jgi:hypothetical protein
VVGDSSLCSVVRWNSRSSKGRKGVRK